MSKRIAIFLLCLAIAMTLGACSKPFGGTPYESISGWVEDFNNLPDGTESDDTTSSIWGAESTGDSTQSATDSATDNSGGTTKSTTAGRVPNGNQSTTSSTTAGRVPNGNQSTTSSTTQNNTGTTNGTTGNDIQLPPIGYSHKDIQYMLVVNDVRLQGKTVTFDFKNVTTQYISEKGSSIQCVCYDKNDKVLSMQSIPIDVVDSQKTVTRSVELHDDTARVDLINWNVPFWTSAVMGPND